MTKSFLSVIALATGLLLSGMAASKDISHEQRDAYEARQTYNKKRSQHEHLLARIAEQEQRVADNQARLAQSKAELERLKAEETTARSELEQARTNLDDKVKSLNEAWDLRNQ